MSYRRTVTEAEARLLDAVMVGAERRRYLVQEGADDATKATVDILEERTSQEAREKYRDAYIRQCEASDLRRELEKALPYCVAFKIVNEVDKSREK